MHTAYIHIWVPEIWLSLGKLQNYIDTICSDCVTKWLNCVGLCVSTVTVAVDVRVAPLYCSK